LPLAFGLIEAHASFVSVANSLFGPIDGLFILLAFITVYKVGAGQTEN
jgi:hypothetical protein